MKLNSNKGAGPDNIPPIFARRCAASSPLSIIYNASLKEGYFPSAWKEARVVPVFKSGDITSITKYRPKSILSVFPKVFETIICPVINWHMKSILTDRQHGFSKRKSTTLNLCGYIDILCMSADNNIQVDAIYIDFTKAFDVVNHSILIKNSTSPF